MKLLLTLTFIALVFLEIDCRRLSRGSKVGGVGRTLGGGVVNLINDLREKPVKMPKGYQHEI